jgi:glutaredoxin
MTDKYIIIGRQTCPFCIRAVDLCIAAKYEYLFLDYDHTPEILEDYKDFYGQSTVPIILANNIETGYTKKVGGYTDLLDTTEQKE